MLTSAEVDTLQISSSSGVVHLIHVARAADDTLLEGSESVWPVDRIELIDEYDVTREAEDVPGTV
jgi:GntR family transcriptional regulator